MLSWASLRGPRHLLLKDTQRSTCNGLLSTNNHRFEWRGRCHFRMFHSNHCSPPEPQQHERISDSWAPTELHLQERPAYTAPLPGRPVPVQAWELSYMLILLFSKVNPGKSLAVPQWASNSSPGESTAPKEENRSSDGYLNKDVHSSQRVETTHMFINKWMDKHIVVCPHKRIWCSHRKEGSTDIATVWINLRNTPLSERSQTWKVTCGMVPCPGNIQSRYIHRDRKQVGGYPGQG